MFSRGLDVLRAAPTLPADTGAGGAAESDRHRPERWLGMQAGRGRRLCSRLGTRLFPRRGRRNVVPAYVRVAGFATGVAVSTISAGDPLRGRGLDQRQFYFGFYRQPPRFLVRHCAQSVAVWRGKRDPATRRQSLNAAYYTASARADSPPGELRRSFRGRLPARCTRLVGRGCRHRDERVDRSPGGTRQRARADRAARAVGFRPRCKAAGNAS